MASIVILLYLPIEFGQEKLADESCERESKVRLLFIKLNWLKLHSHERLHGDHFLHITMTIHAQFYIITVFLTVVKHHTVSITHSEQIIPLLQLHFTYTYLVKATPRLHRNNLKLCLVSSKF